MKALPPILALLGCLLAAPASGWGFLLPPTKILELASKENAQYRGFVITQTAVYYDAIFPGGKIEVPSRLYLKAPDMMRIESEFPGGKFVILASGESALTLVGGRILEKNPPAIADEMVFRDLLLGTTIRALDGALKRRGIDAQESGLSIFEGRLAYALGRSGRKPDDPTLWMDKDLFVPLGIRGLDGSRAFEIVFHQPEAPGGGPSYPERVEFYDGKKLVLEFKTLGVSPSPSLPESLFDIRATRRSSGGVDTGTEPFKSLR